MFGFAFPVLADSGWSLTKFLDNAFKTLGTWGKVIITIIGVVMLVAGIYQVAKGLISHGKTQVSWPVAILLILIGGALAFASMWDTLKNIGQGSKETIQELGNEGSIFLTWLSTKF